MPLVTGNISALLTPGFRVIWDASQEMYPTEYTKFMTVETSTRAYEDDYSITQLGVVPEVNEGAPIPYDTIYGGYTKRYTHLYYGLGFIVSRNMVEDDLYKKIRNMPKALNTSCNETIEILAANHLNRAFNPAFPGGDGVSLCSASHPTFGGGGTYSNAPSAHADLDVTSFEQALIDIQMNFIDDRGKRIRVQPQKLLIHPSNWFMAEKILKSAQEPDTANNAVNPAKGSLPGGYVILHWLTDADAWFIQTNRQHGLQWLWRRRPEFTQDNDFDTENAKYKTTFRASSGWTDPRCIYGSAGA
ncbi:MAG: hypothetical protein DDT19_00863 [Syntrophomonadaceae bacterium]|nr:hypothetical protein [Bacillota bacterium]